MFLFFQNSQIPVSVGVTLYEAVSLYKGKTVIASKGAEGTNLKVHQLIAYCFFGVLAGMVAGSRVLVEALFWDHSSWSLASLLRFPCFLFRIQVLTLRLMFY